MSQYPTSQNIEVFVKNDKISVEHPNVRKMVFVMNALENGWTVKKKGDDYIFRKKHEGRKEVFNKEYLDNFIVTGFDTNQLFGV